MLTIRQQLVALSGETQPCPYCGAQHRGAVFGKPKTAAGEDRAVDLDGGAIGVLMAVRLHQDEERATWGGAYSEHGLVFAREDGTPIPPERITRRFIALVKSSGLRATRVHDLRHLQASLMLAAGVPMAVVSKRLGHSNAGVDRGHVQPPARGCRAGRRGPGRGSGPPGRESRVERPA